MRATASIGILALAALAAAPARGAATASINPTWAEGHHAFTLALTGTFDDKCAPLFSHHEAKVNGNKLVLSVLAQQNPAVRCAVGQPLPYRTEFDAPALDSGTYQVQVLWRQACEFSANPCPVAYNPQDAGSLRVTDSAQLAYRIRPRKAAPGKAFTLHLDGGNFNCADVIHDISVDTARPSLHLDFSVEARPGVECLAPFPGIDFAVPALGEGTWQVFAARSFYCKPGTVCPLLVIMPQLAGALDVEGATSVVPWRPGVRPLRPSRGNGFQAPWRGTARDAAGRSVTIP